MIMIVYSLNSLINTALICSGPGSDKHLVSCAGPSYRDTT